MPLVDMGSLQVSMTYKMKSVVFGPGIVEVPEEIHESLVARIDQISKTRTRKAEALHRRRVGVLKVMANLGDEEALKKLSALAEQVEEKPIGREEIEVIAKRAVKAAPKVIATSAKPKVEEEEN